MSRYRNSRDRRSKAGSFAIPAQGNQRVVYPPPVRQRVENTQRQLSDFLKMLVALIVLPFVGIIVFHNIGLHGLTPFVLDAIWLLSYYWVVRRWALARC